MLPEQELVEALARIDELEVENAKLEATIAELREALREIAAMGDDGYPVSECRNIARAALGEGIKKGCCPSYR